MKYVKVPEPIQVKNLTTGEPLVVDGSTVPWRMHRYLVDIVLPDPSLGKGYRADMVRAAVCETFRHAKPGEYVPVEDAHYEMIKVAVEGPESTTPPILSMQLLPFQESFMEAVKEVPVLTEVVGVTG